ncbi:MAG: NfeD family protein [Acidobacteriota bacterium]
MGNDMIWAITGIVLIFIEFFIPGLVIIFFGVGALVTALVTFVIGNPFSLPLQLLTFSITSILSLVLLRKYMKKIFTGKMENENGSENFNIEIGRIVPVVEYIQHGEIGGKVKYQGTIWSAKSENSIPPGESVEIIGSKNLTLIVKKIKKED